MCIVFIFPFYVNLDGSRRVILSSLPLKELNDKVFSYFITVSNVNRNGFAISIKLNKKNKKQEISDNV